MPTVQPLIEMLQDVEEKLPNFRLAVLSWLNGSLTTKFACKYQYRNSFYSIIYNKKNGKLHVRARDGKKIPICRWTIE